MDAGAAYSQLFVLVVSRNAVHPFIAVHTTPARGFLPVLADSVRRPYRALPTSRFSDAPIESDSFLSDVASLVVEMNAEDSISDLLRPNASVD